MAKPIVLVAEDHELVGTGMRTLLEKQFQVFGPHADGNEITGLVRTLRPDILFLDLSLLNRNGMAIIPEVRELCPETRIIVVTMYDDYYLMEEALRRGAQGYVSKSSGVASLLTAIERVRAGEVYRQPDIHRPPRMAITSPHAAAIAELTPRRQLILSLIGEGLTNGAIAKRLGIAVATVYWHRTHIRRALGVRSEAALARAAMIWFQAEFDAATRAAEKPRNRPERRAR